MAEIRFCDEDGQTFVEINSSPIPGVKGTSRFFYSVNRDQIVEEVHRYLGSGEFVDGPPCDDCGAPEVESLRRTVKALADVIEIMRAERVISPNSGWMG